MIVPPFPEVPYPYPPERPEPERREPLMVPIVYESTGRDPVARLYEQRRILVSGDLDAATSTRVAAELMSLDGQSDRPIELLVNSGGGPIENVFGLLDVMALTRGSMASTCFGRALGTAAVVLASARGPRRATVNATIGLRCPPPDAASATGPDVEHQAEQDRLMRARLATHLAAVTDLTSARAGEELSAGASFDATTALRLGIIDEIVEHAR
jgi:ATP-dependent Clp protease protease subunit